MGSTRPRLLWDNEAIGIGETTEIVPCDGYSRKSVYFLTDTTGDITVEIDPDGGGTWITLFTEAGIGVRAAANPWAFGTEFEFIYLRVTFSVAATVTCWVVTGVD